MMMFIIPCATEEKGIYLLGPDLHDEEDDQETEEENQTLMMRRMTRKQSKRINTPRLRPSSASP